MLRELGAPLKRSGFKVARSLAELDIRGKEPVVQRGCIRFVHLRELPVALLEQEVVNPIVRKQSRRKGRNQRAQNE